MDTPMAFKEVHAEIETKAPVTSELKRLNECPIGKGIRQGDVYILRLDPTKSNQFKGMQNSVDPRKCTYVGGTQLVPGNSIGSNHTIVEGEAKFLIQPGNDYRMFGGVVVAEDRWTLNHPTHACWSLPAGCYGIFYQLDFITKDRVID